MLFLFLLRCGLLRVVLCGLLSWSAFLYRVFWPMRASFGNCLHLSRMLCGYYLSFWVFSICLGFHLLPPPCSSIWLPCCCSPGSTSLCLYLFLLLGVFPFGWFPLCSFFFTSLWLFFLGVWSLLSLSLSYSWASFGSRGSLSSASVESPVPFATGSSLWAESVAVWLLCTPSRSFVFRPHVELSLCLPPTASMPLLFQSAVPRYCLFSSLGVDFLLRLVVSLLLGFAVSTV